MHCAVSANGSESASDEALLARGRGGDEDAFRLLFERHAPILRARVRRRLPDALRRKVSESDVIQAAYMGVYQSLAEFEDRGDGSFKRWLDGIVEHKIRDVLRHYLESAKRSRRKEVSQGYRPETREIAGRHPSPSAFAIGAELESRVRLALARLSMDHRLVIRLVQEEGLTLAQAGDHMGRSSEAVRKLYARAISRLAELTTKAEP